MKLPAQLEMLGSQGLNPATLSADCGFKIAYCCEQTRIFGQNPRDEAGSKFEDPHISDVKNNLEYS